MAEVVRAVFPPRQVPRLVELHDTAPGMWLYCLVGEERGLRPVWRTAGTIVSDKPKRGPPVPVREEWRRWASDVLDRGGAT